MQSSRSDGGLDDMPPSPDGTRLAPNMLGGCLGPGEDARSPGVTVRIVDRIARPSERMELALLRVLCAAALGGRRDGGRWS